jgi:predicted nucleic acid-binding protein
MDSGQQREVSDLLIDSSVLVKWYHSENESEVEQARALRSAHLCRDVDAHILDLAVYEVGNVLGKVLKWQAKAVAEQLDDLRGTCGTPVVLEAAWARDAAYLSAEHNLTFYDAAWAATARALGVPLVSADLQLLSANLAESATAVVDRLRLN